MTVALTLDEDRLVQKLNRVVELAPCTIYGQEDQPNLSEPAMSWVGALDELGIYSLPTDDWATDYQRICDTYGLEPCMQLDNIRANNPNRKSVRS